MQRFAFVPKIQLMSELDLHRARDAHLRTLRSDIVPSKHGILAELAAFVGGRQPVLGKSLCERVFYVQDFAVKPRDFHSWAPPRKLIYQKQRADYIGRFYDILPTATYADLLDCEKAKLALYMQQTQQWVALVQDQLRDIEVAYGKPHPLDLDGVISPSLRSIYDAELERRAAVDAMPAITTTSAASASSTATSSGCVGCKTSEYMIDTIEYGQVCANCGVVAENASTIDETSDSLPFGTQMTLSNNRGCYEMTENFMKNLDLLEGTHNNKVTDAAKEFVKQNVNGRAVSINLIRRILKKGALQRFYPAASVIYEYVTGEQIEKCTKEERQQMHRMHVQYVYAFQACPGTIRRGRKSSLTNNYLTCKFYQMLGLSHRIKYLHMLKCPKKIAEHDRIFSWIVEHVRQTSERRRVEEGTSFWVWIQTPQD